MFVEASIVLPLTVIAVVGAFGLTVQLWERLDRQVQIHLDERYVLFREDADFVRKIDGARETFLEMENDGSKGEQ